MTPSLASTLAKTTALVTGASSGIGAATAKALAAQGAAVALLARRADRLADLKAGIESVGGTALVVAADVTDAEQVEGAVRRTVDELGRLDTVVNNAGLMQSGSAAEAPLRDWDDMVAVNIQGVLYVTRAALPHLIDAAANSPRGVADLVTISSTAGWVARPGTAVYSLTKFGVNAFSEGIRQEVLGKRVRVGVVGPGTVDTEITAHLAEPSREAFERQTAGMVKLRPEDIADAVLFMVTRDRRVAVNHMLVRAAEQTW
jgi:NADP-dependent 3-hydroxy acid dehydrogenase YdfG